MEHTEGLGREAEVWLDGHLLTVCDSVSSAADPCPLGPLENIRFSYVTDEGFTWDQAARGNPSHRKQVEPLRRWSYIGYGRVIQVSPVVVDFGLMEMEDANWTTDESLVGRFVRIPIDRLEICRASKPDWPETIA